VRELRGRSHLEPPPGFDPPGDPYRLYVPAPYAWEVERLIAAERRIARLSEALRWLHANGTTYAWQRDMIDRALRDAGDGGPRGDG
jgi:hypothetical protein